MDKEITKLDFKGQLLFIGIDVHKRQWKITIRSNNMHLKTISINPDPKELYSYMSKNYPGGKYISTYEAGYSGYWIHRELLKLGIHNIIVNPADVPGTHKEKDRKDDSVDSKRLARELNNESLKGIYIPDERHESIRILSRTLQQYSRRNTQVKCRIKALLSFLGVDSQIEVEQRWSRAHIEALSTLKLNHPESEFILKKIHIPELEHIRKQRLQLLKEIREFSKSNEIIQLLRTIPGIGIMTSFTLYAELISMDRFKTIDQLSAIVGLVPSTASSGQKSVVKGLSARHSRYLRYILIEAAWVAIRKDPVFTKSYHLLCKRMSAQRAIIRMTKKLLNRIRSVWKNKQTYVPGTIETKKTKTENLQCNAKNEEKTCCAA
jgi:transposase